MLHGTPDVGRPKLESAQRAASRRSTRTCRSTRYETPLTSENALEIFSAYDVIVDGTDNFPTRYLVNDACVLLGKPNVYGSIFRFEGQASVFATKDGPCYRCLYPEPPPPGLVPSCAEGGVLGVLPGVIGTIQATEAIKLILGIGEPLIGRLLIYDALQMRFRELKLRKDPECPVCGDASDGDGSSSTTSSSAACPRRASGARGGPRRRAGQRRARDHSRAAEGAPRSRRRLRDPRRPRAARGADLPHRPERRVIPLGELPKRVGELDRVAGLVVHCKVGGRSAKAVAYPARARASPQALNLKGGILDWIDKVDPSQPKDLAEESGTRLPSGLLVSDRIRDDASHPNRSGLGAATILSLSPIVESARPLADRVTIRRDTFGVPHILADEYESRGLRARLRRDRGPRARGIA